MKQVSEIARIAPQPAPRPGPAPRKLWQAWFGWWAAACLVALAYSTHQQLAIQQRILAKSLLLEQAVAEAKAVTAASNEQLAKVAELDEATGRLALKLTHIGQVNGAIRSDLLALEGTVAGLYRSIATMEGQVGQSHELLTAIARESGQLQRTLQRSRTTGDAVSSHLSDMVRLQQAVNADLAEMNRKTAPLQQWMEGG